MVFTQIIAIVVTGYAVLEYYANDFDSTYETGLVNDKYRTYGPMNTMTYFTFWIVGLANIISLSISRPFKEPIF